MRVNETDAPPADSVPGRLQVFMQAKALNKAAFARLLNFSYDKIMSYMTGKAQPGVEFWQALVGKFPDAEIGYIVTGVKGAMPIKADMREVPVVDHIPAGPLTQGFGEEGVIGYIRSDVKDPSAFGLIVRGTSMSPEIQEEDIVVCSPSEPFVNGKIYATVIGDGEQSLKRVRFDTKSKAYALIPANKEFPTVYVPEEQVIKLVRVAEVHRDLQ